MDQQWMLVTSNEGVDQPDGTVIGVTYSAALHVGEVIIPLWCGLTEDAAWAHINDFAKANGWWDYELDVIDSHATCRDHIDIVAMT